MQADFLPAFLPALSLSCRCFCCYNRPMQPGDLRYTEERGNPSATPARRRGRRILIFALLVLGSLTAGGWRIRTFPGATGEVTATPAPARAPATARVGPPPSPLALATVRSA